MTDQELEAAQVELARMNSLDKTYQQALVDGNLKVAEAQKAAQDAIATLKQAGADRDLVSAKRTANKNEYGQLYEQVGIELKARLKAAEEAKAAAQEKAKAEAKT